MTRQARAGAMAIALCAISTIGQAEPKQGADRCSGRYQPVDCLTAIQAAVNPEPSSPLPGAAISTGGAALNNARLTQVAAASTQDSDRPLSKDELFGTSKPGDDSEPPLNKDELFGTTGKPGDVTKAKPRSANLHGFLENETAYTYADPAHWSRAVVRAQVGANGQFSENLKWKATVRADVDPIYQWSDFYPDPVKRNQRFDFLIGETYIDTSFAGWDFRLGRQQIVWGEVVGLYFADVVSARDERDFILPSFDIQRIPQWAARAEYFVGDSHLELIWIPYPTYNNIGQPGADFYPFQVPPPPGFMQTFLGEIQPDHTLSNTNYGGRISTLKSGWDMSAFYYRSEDAMPTFVRDVVAGPTPTLVYQPIHDRIWQAGGTLTKDIGGIVVKTEAVYTSGRSYNVTRLSQPTGVVEQDTLDYVLSLDFTLPKDTRLNVQLFQRVFFDHDPDILFDQFESGASILLSGKITPKLQPELLWIQSLNRWENLIRPRLNWLFAPNWRASFGVDIFNGPVTGFFGRYNDRDRVYAEFRYDF